MLRTGPVRALHVLPGRLRLRVDALVGARDRAAGIEGRLTRLDGIERSAVNPVTGSVLIQYRPDRFEPGFLQLVVARLLGLEGSLGDVPGSVLSRELEALLAGIDRALHERSRGFLDLWSFATLVLVAMGTRRVFAEGSRSWPTGVTLLWWALDAAGRGRRRGPS